MQRLLKRELRFSTGVPSCNAGSTSAYSQRSHCMVRRWMNHASRGSYPEQYAPETKMYKLGLYDSVLV